jgi:hypothetical protein
MLYVGGNMKYARILFCITDLLEVESLGAFSIPVSFVYTLGDFERSIQLGDFLLLSPFWFERKADLVIALLRRKSELVFHDFYRIDGEAPFDSELNALLDEPNFPDRVYDSWRLKSEIEVSENSQMAVC